MTSILNDEIQHVPGPNTGITFGVPPKEQSSSTINMLEMVQAAVCFIVSPTIAVIGLISNTFGVIILVKDGLRKSSTIFLMSLTLADSMNLFGAVNPMNLVVYILAQDFTSLSLRWPYSYHITLFLYILDHIINFFVILGCYVCMTLTPAISIERVVAVYFPLTFKRTMTSKKAVVVNFIAYMLWVPWVFFYLSCYPFDYASLKIGMSRLTDFCDTNRQQLHLQLSDQYYPTCHRLGRVSTGQHQH